MIDYDEDADVLYASVVYPPNAMEHEVDEDGIIRNISLQHMGFNSMVYDFHHKDTEFTKNAQRRLTYRVPQWRCVDCHHIYK